MQTKIPCVIMRGGTSRGPFLLTSDLPEDTATRDEVLLALGAETAETPMGPFVRTDDKGRTSVPGVYAAGNVTDPAAIVIVAAAQGATAGGMINMDLVMAAAG